MKYLKSYNIFEKENVDPLTLNKPSVEFVDHVLNQLKDKTKYEIRDLQYAQEILNKLSKDDSKYIKLKIQVELISLDLESHDIMTELNKRLGTNFFNLDDFIKNIKPIGELTILLDRLKEIKTLTSDLLFKLKEL